MSTEHTAFSCQGRRTLGGIFFSGYVGIRRATYHLGSLAYADVDVSHNRQMRNVNMEELNRRLTSWENLWEDNIADKANANESELHLRYRHVLQRIMAFLDILQRWLVQAFHMWLV